jgi:hypothetical protein
MKMAYFKVNSFTELFLETIKLVNILVKYLKLLTIKLVNFVFGTLYPMNYFARNILCSQLIIRSICF